MKNLGERIKHYRQKKEWNQSIAANLLGLSIPAYSKIETNKTIVSVSRLRQLANLFKVPISTLAGETSANNQNHEIEVLNKKLAEHAEHVLVLQLKIIELYEELREVESNETINRQLSLSNTNGEPNIY